MRYELFAVYFLIAATGILTVYTDIKEGKIKNNHLAAVAAVATTLYCVFWFTGILKISLLAPVNILSGLIIGFILYALGAWKAGDAKLFFLYSLILVPNQNSYVLFLPCLSLFANIFLISFVVLIPLSLKNLLCQKKMLLKDILSINTVTTIVKVWLITLCVSFFIVPLINIYIIPDSALMTLAFIFFCYLIYRLLAKIKYATLFISVLVLSVLLKLMLLPGFPPIQQVIDSIKYTAAYSAITILLTRVIALEEKKYTRFPFSPFMLAGTILTTTPFLEWVLKALRYLK